MSSKVDWTVVDSDSGAPMMLLPSVLAWDSASPLEVRVTFGSDFRDTVKWIFARDLLAEVTRDGGPETAGDGDVHVARRDGSLVLTLCTDKRLVLRAEMLKVKAFLNRSFSYCQPGAEEIDVDSAISKLLDGGWTSGV